MPAGEAPIEDTPKGVKVDLTLYVYPDGHANIVFSDDTNWPLADEYEVVHWLTGRLLRPMLQRAKRKARAARDDSGSDQSS